MTSRSQRLKRIERKYVLELDKARAILASAQNKRSILVANQKRLRVTLSALEAASNVQIGRDLACTSEWTARLAGAAHDLEPAISDAAKACDSAERLLRLASGRADHLKRMIHRAQSDEEDYLAKRMHQLSRAKGR